MCVPHSRDVYRLPAPGLSSGVVPPAARAESVWRRIRKKEERYNDGHARACRASICGCGTCPAARARAVCACVRVCVCVCVCGVLLCAVCPSSAGASQMRNHPRKRALLLRLSFSAHSCCALIIQSRHPARALGRGSESSSASKARGRSQPLPCAADLPALPYCSRDSSAPMALLIFSSPAAHH